jgi:phosphoribosylformylglycinamidine (FGAM) synthase-like amidotransferase family enzyme
LRNALASLDLDQLLQAAGTLYESLDAEQQKQLRAVITWIQGGFSLGDQLDNAAA